MKPSEERYFKNKKDKKGFMGDSEETKQFYESIGTILRLNIIQHLNFEFMNLGNRAILLCEYLVDNTSLYSLHLSNNLISGDTIS